MKPILLFSLFITPICCISADFRNLNIGDSCSEVISYESSVGSEYRYKSQGDYTFNGTYLDRDTQIIYSCPKGTLESGTYLFMFDNFEEARDFYLLWKPILISKYGPPALDQGSLAFEEYSKSIGLEFSDEDKYKLFWEKPDSKILFDTSRISIHSETTGVGIHIYSSESLENPYR